jgi:hypothetical protein
MVFTPFIPGKVENMSFGGQSSQYYERRKKSCCDVVASEGSSSDVPLRRSTREDEHRDLPRGHMHIDSEIEEEHIVESSDDDDVEDENYQISPRIARGVVLDEEDDEYMDDAAEIEDEFRRQVEEEEMEERWIRSQRNAKIPFRPKPTLRRAHKPLSYNVINYKGKGTTKEVKMPRKIHPRSHHKGAPDYRFHTRFNMISMKP